MSIRVVDFSAAAAEPILAYASVSAAAVPFTRRRRESAVYAVHPRRRRRDQASPGRFDQLFLVVRGSGWVARIERRPHVLAALQAFIARANTMPGQRGRG